MSKNTRKASWIDGPVVAVGNWEPLAFRRRGGGGTTDLEAKYIREHTPEMVEQLVANGVNLMITHWFKGFGFVGEREDMDIAAELIRHCHARDIRVAGYVGDTFMFETMFLEEPDAADWVQRKANGDPVTFGHLSTYRYKWCRNNPAFMAYMKRVLRAGIEAGLDMIHFDNFLNKPEPKTCRCRHCEAQFREFLTAKYTPEKLKERLGFADLRCTKPPYYSDQMYIGYGDDNIYNPLMQEWIDFRCQTLADSYRDLRDFCRSLKPDIVIESNPTGIWGENAPNMRSVDHARLLPFGQLFWDESPNPHGLLPSGALPTGVRSMKMGQATDNRMLFYAFHGGGDRSETIMGEALSHNGGCIGLVSFLDGDTAPLAAGCLPYVKLLHQYADLYTKSRSMARVAVYRNFASLAYNAWDGHVQAILAEQALLQGHVTFDLVFDLSAVKHSVLIVPGMECLSDDEIKALRKFATKGGNLVLIDNPGRCDEWRRVRVVRPFADVLPAGTGKANLGSGCVVSLAAMQLPAGAPSPSERAIWDDFYRVVDGRFWMMPKNADTLLDLFDKAPFAQARVIKTTAGVNTFVEPRKMPNGKKWLVHVVNYDAKNLGGKLQITLPGITKCTKATLITPHDAPAELKATVTPAGVKLTFDNNRIYSMIEVTL